MKLDALQSRLKKLHEVTKGSVSIDIELWHHSNDHAYIQYKLWIDRPQQKGEHIYCTSVNTLLSVIDDIIERVMPTEIEIDE